MPWRVAASMRLSSARPLMAVPFNVNVDRLRRRLRFQRAFDDCFYSHTVPFT